MDNKEKFKDLFDRLEESKKAYSNYDEIDNIDIDIDDIFKTVFDDMVDINDKSNVFIKCKISKEDAQKGVNQYVKYKYINENGKKLDRKTLIKIPSGIETGSKIIRYSEGNYIKEKGIYSNLILNIEIN